jgi:cytochrome c nitrite reductase small subunit
MPRKKRNPMVSLGVTALILFAFTLSVYIPAGFSSYCSTCHTVSLEAKTWRKGVHRSVACISCHEPDPVVRFPQYAARRVINQVKYEVSHPKRARLSEVDDSGCIGCHRDDITTITVGPADTRSIRMRHSDVVGAGYHCTDCHRTTGHAVVAKAPSGLGGMTRCLECHRDGKAPTACDTCHVEDVMSFAARRTGPYPKTALAAKDCQTCHATDRCTSCHGLQLPHSDAFVEGGHARQAAFEKKRSCWRCHKPGECSKCHVLGKERFSAHAPDWKTTHPSGVTNLDNPGNCRSCHNKSEGPFCRRCH